MSVFSRDGGVKDTAVSDTSYYARVTQTCRPRCTTTRRVHLCARSAGIAPYRADDGQPQSHPLAGTELLEWTRATTKVYRFLAEIVSE